MAPEQKGPRGFTMSDAGEKAAGPSQAPAEITFGNFVLSLAASTFAALGEAAGAAEAEAEAKAEANLPLARQTIDILEMLQTKTKGNLETDEQQLLESILHDLHMRFVEASREKC